MNFIKNKFKTIKLTLIWKFKWIGILFSPFEFPEVKFYMGKIAIGVPYFYPRKWVKFNKKDTHEATFKEIIKRKTYMELNPQSPKLSLDYDEIYNSFKGYTKAVNLTVGFSSCGLGYKTKWSETDYRYEYGPVFSFVFFGYQIAIMIGHKHPDHYWTAWLYYENHTDKKLSKIERIKQCIEGYPLVYTVFSNNTETTSDYYHKVLKPKYKKYIV